MKVKELIEKLSEVDGELEVFFYLQNLGFYESGIGRIFVQDRNDLPRGKEVNYIPPDDTATHFVEVHLG